MTSARTETGANGSYLRVIRSAQLLIFQQYYRCSPRVTLQVVVGVQTK